MKPMTWTAALRPGYAFIVLPWVREQDFDYGQAIHLTLGATVATPESDLGQSYEYQDEIRLAMYKGPRGRLQARQETVARLKARLLDDLIKLGAIDARVKTDGEEQAPAA